METTQTPLPGSEAVLIGLAVCALIIPPAIWPLVQHFQVMAHEGMHAIAGSLSGRKVNSIKLNQDAGGATEVSRPSGCGWLAGAFAGYLGPSAFGLGAARLIKFGHILVVLWVSLLLLGLLLAALKPCFGYLTVPLAGGLIALVLKHTPQSGQIVAAYAITWFLLLSGVRIVVQRGGSAGDAGILSRDTGIHRLVWFALWLIGTVSAAVIGARWMLHPAVGPPQS